MGGSEFVRLLISQLTYQRKILITTHPNLQVALVPSSTSKKIKRVCSTSKSRCAVTKVSRQHRHKKTEDKEEHKGRKETEKTAEESQEGGKREEGRLDGFFQRYDASRAVKEESHS